MHLSQVCPWGNTAQAVQESESLEENEHGGEQENTMCWKNLKGPQPFIDLEINGLPLIGRGTSRRTFKKIGQENGGEVGNFI